MKESIADSGIIPEAGVENSGENADRNAEAAKEKGKPAGLFLRWWITGLLVLGISLMSSAASIVVYDRYFATRIVAVDVKGFIAEQRDLFVQGRIDDEQLRRNIESLEKAIENIPSNEVVIMGDAVVRNAKTIRP